MKAATKRAPVPNGQPLNAKGEDQSLQARLVAEVDQLIKQGRELRKQVVRIDHPTIIGSGFSTNYQAWYTRAVVAVKLLLPERLEEFMNLYQRDLRRKSVDLATYAIQDYLQGVSAPLVFNEKVERVPAFEIKVAVGLRINTQADILASIPPNASATVANLRNLLHANMFDSELAAARDLARAGHLRAAGTVAGVVLEAHLAQLCNKHSLEIGKKHPSIADFSEMLKQGGIFDVPNWRWIQRLADIRNLCGHKKERDPTAEEVEELIGGVDKVVKVLA